MCRIYDPPLARKRALTAVLLWYTSEQSANHRDDQEQRIKEERLLAYGVLWMKNDCITKWQGITRDNNYNYKICGT